MYKCLKSEKKGKIKPFHLLTWTQMEQKCLMYYAMSHHVKLKLVLFTFSHDAPIALCEKKIKSLYVQCILAT